MAEQDLIDDSAQQGINIPSENSTAQPEEEPRVGIYPLEYYRSDVADPINLEIRKQLSEQTIGLEERFKKLEESVKESEPKIKQLGRSLNDYKNSQIRTIEVVSIFVAFLA